jgi:hypothetical protein
MTENLPEDFPPEVVPILREAGYLDDDRLHVGDRVPELSLFSVGGVPISLRGLWVDRPVVLIFGSYT